MHIQSFKIFCDLVESGSFSQAAEVNHVTQSAVSQQVRALEERLGVQLLRRGQKHFSLTPEGRVFLRASQDILLIYDDLGHRLQDLQDTVAGILRISTIHSVGLHELPPHLSKFRRLFPDVDVQVEYRRASHVYSDILAGAADIGFVAFPVRRTGLHVEPVWQDRLVLICPPDHPLASRRSVKFRDLRGTRFIAFEPDQPTARALENRLRQSKLELRHAHEFDNIETVKRAVQIDSGVSIVPLATVQDELSAGRLAAIEIDEEDMWRPLGILTRRNRSVSPAQRRFLDLLRASEPHLESTPRTSPKPRRKLDDTQPRPGASRRATAAPSTARRRGRAEAE